MLSITDVCQLIKSQRGEEIARKVSSRAGLDPWASTVLSTTSRAASTSTTHRYSAATSEDTSEMRQPSPQNNEMVTALGRGQETSMGPLGENAPADTFTTPPSWAVKQPGHHSSKAGQKGVLLSFRITPQSPGHWVAPPGISPSTPYLPAPSSKSQEYTTQKPLLPSIPRLEV